MYEVIITTLEYRDKCIESGLDESVSEVAAANAAIACGECFTLLKFSMSGSMFRKFSKSLESLGVVAVPEESNSDEA